MPNTRPKQCGGGAPLGVVAVGASAGGVEALTRMAANLPTDLPYAILVALHIPPGGPREAEHAMGVLSSRLRNTAPDAGEHGVG